MTLADKIRFHRVKLGMTQEDLAKKLHTTKQTIGKYENSIVTNLPLSRIEELSVALDVSPAYLMGWEEDQPGQRAELIDEAVEEYEKLSDDDKEKVSAFIRFLLSQKVQP